MQAIGRTTSLHHAISIFNTRPILVVWSKSCYRYSWTEPCSYPSNATSLQMVALNAYYEEYGNIMASWTFWSI
jgi:hypothetical protein